MNKRPHTWWWDYCVPDSEVGRRLSTQEALERFNQDCPKIPEHDYYLATDGSGHQDGCGGYAATYFQVGQEEVRYAYGSNFGQTVQRNELRAFLEGLHAILQWEVSERLGKEASVKVNYESLSEDPVRVFWHTDRQNLAAALLFREDHSMLGSRNTDRDLWGQFAVLNQYTCVSPILAGRNTEALQANCDQICGDMRRFQKLYLEQTKLSAPPIQKALI